jgi:release factor glutamine methyltransferase
VSSGVFVPRPRKLHAADVDPVAVRCARDNLGTGGQVYEGDLYRPLPAGLRGRVDVLVANVPYVPTGAIALMPREAREHEPRVALDGGAHGLDLLRRFAAAAPRWLAPGGSMLVETSEGQATQASENVARSGLSPRVASSDELESTVVIGTRPVWADPHSGSGRSSATSAGSRSRDGMSSLE